MCCKVLVYDKEWQDIPTQDWPPAGAVFVCRDPQRRTAPECWNVAIMGNGTLEGDTVQLGLFWHREDAVLFAESKLRTLQNAEEN